jgi:hypothetical protein
MAAASGASESGQARHDAVAVAGRFHVRAFRGQVKAGAALAGRRSTAARGRKDGAQGADEEDSEVT